MGGLAGFFKSQLLNNEISNKKLNNDTAVKWMTYVDNQSEGFERQPSVLLATRHRVIAVLRMFCESFLLPPSSFPLASSFGVLD
jgi:hypothetical protein